MIKVIQSHKSKTIMLFFCLLLTVSLLAQNEKASKKGTIVMTKSELNSFLSTVADARRSQLQERENKQSKSELSDLRLKYQQRPMMESNTQYNITNEQLLREIRYLNQRIDDMSPNYGNNRFPSMARDKSTIIMPNNSGVSPSYNPNGNSTTTLIPSNKAQIKNLQQKIDSLKNIDSNQSKLKADGAFGDSLRNMKGRLTDVRRKMDSLESKMNSKTTAKVSDENKTYFRQQVYFANNSDMLDDAYLKYIDELTKIMMEYPEAKILLEGWASPVGSVTYNKQISMRRAESVEKAFINNKIQASRIITSFKGEDSKSSAEKARRVEMSIIVR
ncbi:outer membrane protein OmpA-like peptidoglycan-associated protein [Flavobacterium sp. PL11]|jgi:outer membrane protein OmpA-like peptidoglycan-associated protein|uniref:OmpA family protein n=1 Tax=Flavobacterium sp. PL11 TaxID=3071717 RepID=UPI002DFA63F2|nr:outer membrane protein OmpA-like peptidoglycan-associated protein [Flavobacterium sp. PL11]